MVLVYIFVIISSCLFIAEEMGHHDCCGEDCPICETIEICIENVRSIGCAVIVFVALASIIYATPDQVRKIRSEDTACFTLVSSKVRLDY